MDRGTKLWFNTCGADGDELHPLFQQTVKGRYLRRGLVRGTLEDAETQMLQDTVPEFCSDVLGWWRRKQIGKPGARRELTEGDHLANGVMLITEEDWERWIGKKVGNKAADFMGVHINLMKAMMRRGCIPRVCDEGEGGVNSKNNDPSPALGIVHAIRRGLQAILTTGLVADNCYDEVLCTLNKVVGSVDVLDTRPIGLLFLWRNMMMGIQFYKVMHTLESLDALAKWQTGGRVGQGTDIALLEAQLMQEYCWMTRTELHRGLEDKKRAYDSPQHLGGMDLAMDRLAVPYRLIMLSTKLDKGSRMRVRTAHGMSEYFNRWRGLVQGGEDSPGKWVIFDDPFCTKMEELEAAGAGAVMAVPFCQPVSTSGKSFVDDKSYMSNTHDGLAVLFQWAEKYNGFTGTEMKPPKGGVQSLVPKGKGFATGKDLADLIVHLFEADKDMIIPRYEPDEPMKYLGILSTVMLSWGWSVDAAMEVADRVALCIKTGSRMGVVSHRLMSTVAAPAVLYKMMVASVGERDFQTIQAGCYTACKAAIGLARTTPNDVVSAVVSLDWWNQHCVGQILMVMKMLLSSRVQTRGLLESSVRMHQLWSGAAEAGLGDSEAQSRGWDGTMLGRLHMWMGKHGFQLKGGGSLPLGREHDVQLTALAAGASAESERELVATGAWLVDAWRLSDILRLDGKTVGRWFRVPEGAVKAMVAAEGNDMAGWYNLLEDRLGITGGVVAEQHRLGKLCRGSIHLHGRVALMVEGVLTVGEVCEDECGGAWSDLVKVQCWLVVGSGGLRTSARAVSGQLYSKAGGSVRVVEAGLLVKVQVYERQDGLYELDETVELVCLLLDSDRVDEGCNSSPVWEFPARQRMMGWGTSIKHVQSE